MNRRFTIFLLLALWAGMMVAQDPLDRPQRTPEEEAIKQTTRLIRELGIRDSVRIDTLYRMHLKYARFRQKGLTRAENMARMQSIYSELERLLTVDEFRRFMNHPAEQPRHPRGAQVINPSRPVLPIDSLPAPRQ